ncbi:hypothetical protein BRI6_4556 [plant metagenome]|uniref:Uncharacterized protein n=1 Tax=plant metagenome TaxID=1297885 RepID=A0A484YSN9_9ZZZZ
MAAAYPEHAEDTAYKITLFGLGLLYMRPELASRLREALRQGNCSVDVQIHAQDVHVHLVAAPHDYETAYVLCDQSGVPAQVH